MRPMILSGISTAERRAVRWWGAPGSRRSACC